MSLFCLCVVDNIDRRRIGEKNEMPFNKEIGILERKYKIGINYSVDWLEPIMMHFKEHSILLSISDSPMSSNCELFLLPDGWFVNGFTNEIRFKERMIVLQEISALFPIDQFDVNLYLAQSGTCCEDYTYIELKSSQLADYLTDTIGKQGIDMGIHIHVI